MDGSVGWGAARFSLFAVWGKRLVCQLALSRRLAIKAHVSHEIHQCRLPKGEFRKPTIETISIEW